MASKFAELDVDKAVASLEKMLGGKGGYDYLAAFCENANTAQRDAFTDRFVSEFLDANKSPRNAQMRKVVDAYTKFNGDMEADGSRSLNLTKGDFFAFLKDILDACNAKNIEKLKDKYEGRYEELIVPTIILLGYGNLVTPQKAAKTPTISGTPAKLAERPKALRDELRKTLAEISNMTTSATEWDKIPDEFPPGLRSKVEYAIRLSQELLTQEHLKDKNKGELSQNAHDVIQNSVLPLLLFYRGVLDASKDTNAAIGQEKVDKEAQKAALQEFAAAAAYLSGKGVMNLRVSKDQTVGDYFGQLRSSLSATAESTSMEEREKGLASSALFAKIFYLTNGKRSFGGSTIQSGMEVCKSGKTFMLQNAELDTVQLQGNELNLYWMVSDHSSNPLERIRKFGKYWDEVCTDPKIKELIDKGVKFEKLQEMAMELDKKGDKRLSGAIERFRGQPAKLTDDEKRTLASAWKTLFDKDIGSDLERSILSKDEEDVLALVKGYAVSIALWKQQAEAFENDDGKKLIKYTGTQREFGNYLKSLRASEGGRKEYNRLMALAEKFTDIPNADASEVVIADTKKRAKYLQGIYDGEYNWSKTLTPTVLDHMDKLVSSLNSAYARSGTLKDISASLQTRAFQEMIANSGITSPVSTTQTAGELKEVGSDRLNLAASVLPKNLDTLKSLTLYLYCPAYAKIKDKISELQGDVAMLVGLYKSIDNALLTGDRVAVESQIGVFESRIEDIRGKFGDSIADRIARQFYSKWDIEFLQNEYGKNFGSGEQYKNFTETIRALAKDNSFKKRRDNLLAFLLGGGATTTGLLKINGKEVEVAKIGNAFASFSPQTQYELMGIFGVDDDASFQTYGQTGTAIEKFCTFVNAINTANTIVTFDPSVPLMLKRIGKELSRYDTATIEGGLGIILNSMASFVPTGEYDKIERGCDALPKKLSDIFVTVAGLRDQAREPNKGLNCMIQRPANEPDIIGMTFPGYNLTIEIKAVYNSQLSRSILQTMGAKESVINQALSFGGQGFQSAFSVPVNLLNNRGTMPDIATTHRIFMEDKMIQDRLDISIPSIIAPISLLDLYKLAFDDIPDVGPMYEAEVLAAPTVTYERTNETKTVSRIIPVTASAIGEGQRQDYSYMYTEGYGSGERLKETHNANVSVVNQPLPGGQGVLNVHATVTHVHEQGVPVSPDDLVDAEVQNLNVDGAERLITFKMVPKPADYLDAEKDAQNKAASDEDKKYTESYKVYFYDRGKNGDWIRGQVETLTRDELIAKYEDYGLFKESFAQLQTIAKNSPTAQTMRLPPTPTKLKISGKQLQAGDAYAGEGSITNDWQQTLDGVTILIGDKTKFGGAGASLEKIGAGGAWAAEEETRGQRVAGGGGWIDPKTKTFMIGKIFAADLKKDDYYTGEMAFEAWFLKSEKFQFKALIGAFAPRPTEHTLSQYEGAVLIDHILNTGGAWHLGMQCLPYFSTAQESAKAQWRLDTGNFPTTTPQSEPDYSYIPQYETALFDRIGGNFYMVDKEATKVMALTYLATKLSPDLLKEMRKDSGERLRDFNTEFANAGFALKKISDSLGLRGTVILANPEDKKNFTEGAMVKLTWDSIYKTWFMPHSEFMGLQYIAPSMRTGFATDAYGEMVALRDKDKPVETVSLEAVSWGAGELKWKAEPHGPIEGGKRRDSREGLTIGGGVIPVTIGWEAHAGWEHTFNPDQSSAFTLGMYGNFDWIQKGIRGSDMYSPLQALAATSQSNNTAQSGSSNDTTLSGDLLTKSKIYGSAILLRWNLGSAYRDRSLSWETMPSFSFQKGEGYAHDYSASRLDIQSRLNFVGVLDTHSMTALGGRYNTSFQPITWWWIGAGYTWSHFTGGQVGATLQWNELNDLYNKHFYQYLSGQLIVMWPF